MARANAYTFSLSLPTLPEIAFYRFCNSIVTSLPHLLDELATEHKSSVVPSEQCTTNDTMIQRHLGEQPEETEGLHVQVVQPKPRVSTLGHDREASAGEKSEEIVDEEKQPKEHQHQFHSHEEGDVCACEHFTANYTRIRSQFSKFEGSLSLCLCFAVVCFPLSWTTFSSLSAYLHLLLLFIGNAFCSIF